jgi:Tfp pilus assembly protein PilV
MRTKKRFRGTNGRSGISLLEVTLASALLAASLIPAASLLRQSNELGRRLTTRERMLTAAQDLIESHRLQVAQGVFSAGTGRGTVTSHGITNLDSVGYSWQRTVSGSDLVTIDVSVWQDTNKSGAQDANDPQVRLITQAALPR